MASHTGAIEHSNSTPAIATPPPPPPLASAGSGANEWPVPFPNRANEWREANARFFQQQLVEILDVAGRLAIFASEPRETMDTQNPYHVSAMQAILDALRRVSTQYEELLAAPPRVVQTSEHM